MFSKEVKDNLSKYKYIYRIYGEDNNFHIEHYPIVYINSKYIYYKGKRKDMLLNYVRVDKLWWEKSKLFENIEESIEYINNKKETWNCPSVYFISEKLKDYDLSKIKIYLKEESSKNKIKQMENRAKKAKEEYERALKELDDAKNKN